MAFAIICDARAGESLGVSVLALVDRAKSRRQWWTSDDPSIAMRYQEEGAARFAARRLRHNRARVVPFDQAAETLREQRDDIIHRAAIDDAEQGWDAHKGAWQ